MTMLPLTPSQTVGPFFLQCLLRDDARCTTLVGPETVGARLRIVGHVYDGDGAGVPDALVEIWQANHYGRYNHPADPVLRVGPAPPLDPYFTGFGRSGTDADGVFTFETIKPGPVPFDGARMQAPHICVAVLGRGLLNHLLTRLYFADDPATAADPVLRCVPEARRATLLAQPSAAAGIYIFDIVLQGAGETAFFDL